MHDSQDHTTLPLNWHPQDWLLTAHTLQYWAETDPAHPQAWYAHYLSQCLMDYLDIPDQELTRQRDAQWKHHEHYTEP